MNLNQEDLQIFLEEEMKDYEVHILENIDSELEKWEEERINKWDEK
jgi:hypothetical protein